MIDPDEERYRRKYPTFPGVKETVRLLKLGGTTGGYLEAVLWDLSEHAPQVLDDVTLAVDQETDERVRTLLVAELAETGDERLVGFFVRLLSDGNESIRHWAQEGLRGIDTKDARKALFTHQGASRPPATRPRESGPGR